MCGLQSCSRTYLPVHHVIAIGGSQTNPSIISEGWMSDANFAFAFAFPPVFAGVKDAGRLENHNGVATEMGYS